MSDRSDLDCVEDMLEAARRATGYCAGLTYDAFIVWGVVVDDLPSLIRPLETVVADTRRTNP